jgi:hypothetical protein
MPPITSASPKSIFVPDFRARNCNVGCERCRGPGSEHVEHPARGNILDPARLGYVAASDTCIQCHSPGVRQRIPSKGNITTGQ